MDYENKRTKVRGSGIGGFFLTFFLNLVLSFEWAVPGVLLIVAHYIVPQYVPLWAGIVALGIWVGVRLIQTIVLCLMVTIGNRPSVNEERYKANKNPYSKHGEYERKLAEKKSQQNNN